MKRFLKKIKERDKAIKALEIVLIKRITNVKRNLNTITSNTSKPNKTSLSKKTRTFGSIEKQQ